MPSMFDTNADTDKRKLLSVLCHGSIFFSSLVFSAGIPLVISFVSDDPVVKANAKEALNFHLNIWTYEAILAVLAFTIVALPLVWLIAPFFFLFHWIPAILAIFSALNKPNEPYKYPFIVRVF
jgi:uncharacterized protein